MENILESIQREPDLAPAGMWYILDDNKNPVECRDYPTIIKWCKGRKLKGVRSTHVAAGKYRYWVSTVFLMLDSPGGMFETMVFSEGEDTGPNDDFMVRYPTYEQAVKGHKKLCRLIKQRKIIDDF